MTIESNIPMGAGVISNGGLKDFFAGDVFRGASSFMSGNPVIAGLNVANALAGVKTDISGAGGSGASSSGVGIFGGDGSISFGGVGVDLSNPYHIAMLAVGVVGAVWLYHQFKG